jgi:hypothetical protein
VISVEALRRAEEILARLAAGERPDARALAGAPLAQAWATISGEDIWRIGAVLATTPQHSGRPRIVPLLAIDREGTWALVVDARELRWWVLGDRLPEAPAAEDSAEVIRLATAWVRRWLGP